jgi:WD40 repeat protein
MQLVDRLLSAETRMTLLSVPGVTQVSCLSFSPCGRFLAVGSAVNGSLVVWDMDWQQPTLIRRMASGTLELAFSPDGLYLLVSQQSSRHEK